MSTSRGLWVQSACTALVAIGAAFASYRHGRQFATRFGADGATASIWPLIVDGLLVIATIELWKPSREASRWTAWLAFTFGISLSLCANIGSAPELTVFGVTVAACPPLALLLAVELLNRALKHRRAETCSSSDDRVVTNDLTEAPPTMDRHQPGIAIEPTAEQRMWQYYQAEQSRGRTPTGADLDRVAGTHNYGRRILRTWRTNGWIPARQTGRPQHGLPGTTTSPTSEPQQKVATMTLTHDYPLEPAFHPSASEAEERVAAGHGGRATDQPTD